MARVSLNILSIQSWVAYGHVGNASAIFPLQRLGAEVWGVHTVQFSNHTGYGAWRGQVFGAELISECVAGIEERGVLGRCDAVLSGYLGSAEIGVAVRDAALKVKAANSKALWCCDPVIGDTGRGVFVRPGIPEFLRDQALPAADIATPNQFELEWLTGQVITSLDTAKAAITALQAKGPRIVLLTSLRTEATGAGEIELLAAEDGGFWRLRTPMLPLSVNGAGDAIAALFLFHRLQSGGVAPALEAAASSIFGLLSQTLAAGARELQVVAAQAEITAPTRRFVAEAC
ncbi:MAG: pyridoxal kinase PdxY [Roseomonas sp.]|nr:pyridoxal kinase PdxY [Roseomonas sp.]MCA3326656.1 pyridoxal kinase PdxY [Roseomonas sp.]MCA3329449.1 pyridoxal kinase PdxY [Roseomonas sp.]MCA3335801.1 pyridoxal kinase PdxY [Roseomonas sp.]MCA3347471.1 pyridoxal kinase PdxY [Roseomonas sp.]